jgi:hypothetical protein
MPVKMTSLNVSSIDKFMYLWIFALEFCHEKILIDAFVLGAVSSGRVIGVKMRGREMDYTSQ